MKIILASTSPRRREILDLAGISFEVENSDTDETITGDVSPAEYVDELSLRKAGTVAKRHPDDIVIGADTIVTYDDRILGKPKDHDEAFEMLCGLSGRTHSVYTGVTIIYPSGEFNLQADTFHVITEVTMYDSDKELLRSYADSGEPLDKAGAYAIQGRGAVLVERIEGDYYNVMGLPIAELYRHLLAAGIPGSLRL